MSDAFTALVSFFRNSTKRPIHLYCTVSLLLIPIITAPQKNVKVILQFIITFVITHKFVPKILFFAQSLLTNLVLIAKYIYNIILQI